MDEVFCRLCRLSQTVTISCYPVLGSQRVHSNDSPCLFRVLPRDPRALWTRISHQSVIRHSPYVLVPLLTPSYEPGSSISSMSDASVFIGYVYNPSHSLLFFL